MSINIVKMINKNVDDYNYINICYDINVIYHYNITEHLYNVFFKKYENLTRCLIGSAEYKGIDYERNSKSLYPKEIKLNDFDIIVGSMKYQGYDYQNTNKDEILFIQNLMKMLIEIDKDLIIYFIKPNYSTQYNNFSESDFINIGNDLSKLKYECVVQEYNQSNSKPCFNVIIKSKIIDMNLLYYLIYNDMRVIQIYKKYFRFTLKDNSNFPYSKLIVKNIKPIYETDKYKLNPKNGYSSIMNIDIYKYIEDNISFDQNSNLKTESNSDLIPILQQELDKQLKINEELQKENEELKLKLSKQNDIIQKLLN